MTILRWVLFLILCRLILHEQSRLISLHKHGKDDSANCEKETLLTLLLYLSVKNSSFRSITQFILFFSFLAGFCHTEYFSVLWHAMAFCLSEARHGRKPYSWINFSNSHYFDFKTTSIYTIQTIWSIFLETTDLCLFPECQ